MEAGGGAEQRYRPGALLPPQLLIDSSIQILFASSFSISFVLSLRGFPKLTVSNLS